LKIDQVMCAPVDVPIVLYNSTLDNCKVNARYR